LYDVPLKDKAGSEKRKTKKGFYAAAKDCDDGDHLVGREYSQEK
jgi:hypothetical protein